MSQKILYNIKLRAIVSEVSPVWLRYELPKLGIAGSNPALRILTQLLNVHFSENVINNILVTHEKQKNEFLKTSKCFIVKRYKIIRNLS